MHALRSIVILFSYTASRSYPYSTFVINKFKLKLE